MADTTPPLNLRDFKAVARERLDQASFDYYAGGADDEQTLADNERAFARLRLRPRVLSGVDAVDTSTRVLDVGLPFPVGLAPTAFQKLGHPDGELATARAASAAGTLMCCSTIASASLEDIASEATSPLWFQLYVYRDRDVTRDLIRRAEIAEYEAIILTVDTPRLGRRERDFRNDFTLPPGVTIRNLERYHKESGARWAKGSSFTQYVHALLDASLTWESLDWIASLTKLPILVKGILSPDDVDPAIEHGAAGLIVSNHGGRQLDGVQATIDALPDVVARAAGRLPVLMDGGVRRGTDVVKALALGASAAFIGRPYLWGLAADGEAGVARVLSLLQTEFELAMALCGCRSVKDIGPELVVRP